MSRAPSRSLFPLDVHTWVAVLAIGVGFGSVASLGLAAAHEERRALLCLALPIAFAYTAATLERPGPLLRPRVAILANWALIVAAVGLAVLAVTPIHRDHATPAHPLVVAVTAMAVLLQVAVIVVAVESIGRLRGTTRRHLTRHVIRGGTA